jgi:hypothetical protein
MTPLELSVSDATIWSIILYIDPSIKIVSFYHNMFKVQATVATIVNYDCNIFIVLVIDMIQASQKDW